MTTERQYGLWDSDITFDLLSQETVTYDAVRVQSQTGNKYLLEGRSDGRNVLVEIDNSGNTRDVLPEQYSVGTKVHEYGGSAFNVDHFRDLIFFSNQPDNALHTLNAKTGHVECIVKHDGWRFADFDFHSTGWVVAIREVHNLKDDRPTNVVNELVLVDPAQKEVKTLVSGADFYSQAKFSPNGKRICWLEWQNPEMPWTGTRLFVAPFDQNQGVIGDPELVAGTGKRQSISQARWRADGTLFFADDQTGFWQLYLLRHGEKNVEKLKINGLKNVDLAMAEFRLGSCTYLPMSTDKLILTYHQRATCYFAEVDISTGSYQDLNLHLVDIPLSAMAKVSEDEIVIIGTPRDHPAGLYHVSIAGSKPTVTLMRQSMDLKLPTGSLSLAEPFQCSRTHGEYQDGQVHGFLLKPQNPAFHAPSNTLPPLLVFAHGGPTGHYKPAFNIDYLYWTTRGYAVLLVNYAGSTGFGRDYIRLLDSRWGAIDAADAASAAAALASRGIVDSSRIGVWGASAGGYIVLKTICDDPSIWAAGVSLFGIADTRTFAVDTHKFEHYYADALLFGSDKHLSDAERNAINVQRSPVCHAQRVTAPTLILQGDQDKVVPPQQAIDMRDALQKHGKTVELEMFEGEGHSQWRGEAMKRRLLAEERWWKKYLVRSG